MAPKPKADAINEVLIYDDAYMRARKFAEVKPTPLKPKADLTIEELSLPTAFQALPEIKPSIQYWLNGGTVKYEERGWCKWPTDMKHLDITEHEELRKPKKEVQDFVKVMKGVVKSAEKVKNQCFKQFEKCEAKYEKRKGIVEKINEIETEIHDELHRADQYAKRRKLFATKYMYGSKLGQHPPAENVAIVAEISDKMSEWMEEAREDVAKFFAVVEKQTETFNFFLLGPSVTPYKPQYQGTHSKTGAQDCQKWFNKQFTSKAASGAPWPPDWTGLFYHLVDPESTDTLPSSIHVVCSKAPSSLQRVSGYLDQVRKDKGQAIPVTIVAFDPDADRDMTQRALFTELTGTGEFLVDTTKIDIEYVEKTLTTVKTKKKTLEKLQKQLDKIEDVSVALETNRKLLQVQIALEGFVKNDLSLIEEALKKPAPELNSVNPK